MKKSQVLSYGIVTGSGPEYTYFQKTYFIDKSGVMHISTHRLLRIGEIIPAAVRIIPFFNGSVLALEDCKVRIIHANGKTSRFNQGDLSSQALSSKAMTLKAELMYLPLSDYLKPHDFIEIYTVHTKSLPRLGIQFSLADLEFPAENIECDIQVSPGQHLLWKVMNDTLSPQITRSASGMHYQFVWSQYKATNNIKSPYQKRNTAPGVLGTIGIADSMNSLPDIRKQWIAFGDWYLDLIRDKLVPSPSIKILAHQVIGSAQTASEKMEAIFNYCRDNIRYEQVYIANGEWIPNDGESILHRKYGDCKDYALIIYLMAKSVGLDPQLALTFRGTGVEFYPGIPVPQFNHMLATFKINGQRYWYDGTNGAGPPLPTRDLTNAPVLILKKHHSKIASIPESDAAYLNISGHFTYRDNTTLSGSVTIVLQDQYALGLMNLIRYLNPGEIQPLLKEWIHRNIHSEVQIRQLTWQQDNTTFTLDFEGDFHNALLKYQGTYYTSIKRLCDQLLPNNVHQIAAEDFDYFPYYARVNTTLVLDGFRSGNDDETVQVDDAVLSLDYYIPPGPYTAKSRTFSMEQLNKANQEYTVNHSLKRE